MKQIITLLKIQLLQYMGMNEARYAKDKKKKNKLYLLLGTYIFLGVMLAFYMGAGAFGLCILGAADIVPAYMLTITSLVILFFTIFKAGSMLFQVKSYEMLISLPIKPVVIVISRFLNMYLGNLVLSFVTMIPAGIVYGIYVRPGISFYIMFVISIFLLPLVPLTIASIIGAIITGIGARMKHKNAVTIIISMLLTMGILVISFYPTLHAEDITMQQLTDISAMASEQIHKMYPLARMYTEAVVGGNISAFLGFAGISIGVFAIFAGITQRKYAAICANLISHAAKKNYVLGRQTRRSPLMALYSKEIKRYFSSSIYVMNTAIGYIMMIMAAVALLLVGVDKIGAVMEMEGVVRDMIEKFMPFALAIMGVIGTTTLSSISIEGKQWWIPKTLPVSAKLIFDSKIMVNLTLAVPSCIIAGVISMAALGNQGLKSIWLLIIPLMYCLFFSVLGIAVNLKYPMFQWDNEVVAVKQGAALLVGMLIEFPSVIIGGLIIHILGSFSYNFAMLVLTVILAAITIIIYKKNMKYELRKLY